MSLSKGETVQMIKRAIAYRAKFRADQGPAPTYKVFSPLLVVPHPRNRGGDPVRAIRTMQLSGTIAQDGCDPVKASSNAVAEEE